MLISDLRLTYTDSKTAPAGIPGRQGVGAYQRNLLIFLKKSRDGKDLHAFFDYTLKTLKGERKNGDTA